VIDYELVFGIDARPKKGDDPYDDDLDDYEWNQEEAERKR